MEILTKYFKRLSPEQLEQFGKLQGIYTEWNEKINVISRKDIEQLYERHVLHSLAIARVIDFKPNTSILDIGTGGGFPGIPLAILFPECKFTLVDSIGKKITVVNEAVAALGLKNITTQHARAEAINGTFDFIVSRAVAPTGDIIRWTKKYLSVHHFHEKFNGWLLLKGGDLKEELSTVREQYQLFSIPKYFNEPFFEEKFVVYVNNKNIPTFTKKKKIWG